MSGYGLSIGEVWNLSRQVMYIMEYNWAYFTYSFQMLPPIRHTLKDAV